jgi:hypothetical protein
LLCYSNYIATQNPENTMNAYATIEFLSSTTNNGRTVRRALVDLSTATGQWLGSFSVFGFTTQQLKDRAYMEADLNLTHKGYTLQSLREAA